MLKDKETIAKDSPHPDVGKSKYKVKLAYTIWADYEVVAENKDEAYETVQEIGGLEKIRWREGFHRNNDVKVIAEDWNPDVEESFEVHKIEECVPYEDTEYKDFSDPYWTSDEFEWQTGEDQ